MRTSWKTARGVSRHCFKLHLLVLAVTSPHGSVCHWDTHTHTVDWQQARLIQPVPSICFSIWTFIGRAAWMAVCKSKHTRTFSLKYTVSIIQRQGNYGVTRCHSKAVRLPTVLLQDSTLTANSITHTPTPTPTHTHTHSHTHTHTQTHSVRTRWSFNQSDWLPGGCFIGSALVFSLQVELWHFLLRDTSCHVTCGVSQSAFFPSFSVFVSSCLVISLWGHVHIQSPLLSKLGQNTRMWLDPPTLPRMHQRRLVRPLASRYPRMHFTSNRKQ